MKKISLGIICLCVSLVEFSSSMNPQPSDDSGRVLKTGLVDLYQSLVYIAYLRADILFGDLKGNVARECANAHVDDILSDLPPSVQFAMHTSLDDDFVRKFKVTLDKIRNEIPAGVVVNPDETIEFPRGYNVGADGIPAGGNGKLLPIPPAFRYQSSETL